MAHSEVSTGECPRPTVGNEAKGTKAFARLGRCLTYFMFASVLALAACSGENERAGREKDKAASTEQGEDYSGSGPNQRIGEAQDRAAVAEERVRDSAADALEAQARNVERQADIDATRLDEQARAVRGEADKQADALEKQAKATRE